MTATVLCVGYQRVRPNGSITGASQIYGSLEHCISLIDDPRQCRRWGNRRVPEPVLGAEVALAIEGGHYWLYSEWPRVS